VILQELGQGIFFEHLLLELFGLQEGGSLEELFFLGGSLPTSSLLFHHLVEHFQEVCFLLQVPSLLVLLI